MPKKLLLALLTLSALILLFFIMRGLTPAPERRGPATEPARPPVGVTSRPQGNVIEQRDAVSGRVVRRMEFADAVPYPDHIEVTRLHVTLFAEPDTAGRVALTTLDAGKAVLRRKPAPGEKNPKPMALDSKMDFSEADLSGGVQVLHDGGTPADTADDLHVRTDSVAYRADTGRLTTDDAVDGGGSGATFHGRGLAMNIEPRTRRLKDLRVARDVDMTLAGESAQVLFASEGDPGARRPPEPLSLSGRGQGEGTGRAPHPNPLPEGERGRPATRPVAPTRITCRGPLDVVLTAEDRRATWSNDVRVSQEGAFLTADTLVVEFAPPAATATRPRGGRTNPGRLLGRPKGATAKGDVVHFADPRAGREIDAVGRELRVRIERRPGEAAAREHGNLLGGPLATIRQGPKLDTVITAREFQFDRGDTGDLIRAEGAPVLTLVQAPESAGAKARIVRVSCDKSIVMDGASNTAVLTDRVRVAETQDAATLSTIDADWMKVTLEKAPERQVKAVQAKGHVQALQEGRQIQANELEVRFAGAAAERKPSYLKAAGAVDMKEQATGRRVTADEVVADLATKRTTISGKPARLVEPDRTVTADRMVVDQSTDPPGVEAEGPGQIRVVETKGRDGKPLDPPRTSTIDWRDRMAFKPQAKTGWFEGGVVARLPEGALDCGRLDLVLRPPAAGAKAGALEIQSIEAATDVKFVRGTDIAQGKRLTWNVGTGKKDGSGTVYGSADRKAEVRQGNNVIRAPQIDLDEKAQGVKALGAGDIEMVRRDAAHPEAKAETSRIEWSREMEYAAGGAEFRGGVKAEFAGGDLGVRAGGASAAAMGLPGAGAVERVELTDADTVRVEFEDRPDTRPQIAPRTATQPAPTVQVLTRFVARAVPGGEPVRLAAFSKNVVRRFEGRTATYSRDQGQVVIEGSGDTAARVWSVETAPTGEVYEDQVLARRIEFYPDRGEFVTQGTLGMGFTPRTAGTTSQPAQKPKPLPRLLWSRGGK